MSGGGPDAIQVVELWRKQGSERRMQSPEQMTILYHCGVLEGGKMMPQESVSSPNNSGSLAPWVRVPRAHIGGGYSLCNLGVELWGGARSFLSHSVV